MQSGGKKTLPRTASHHRQGSDRAASAPDKGCFKPSVPVWKSLISGVHSVNDSLKRLEIGASLSAAELLSICSLLEAAKRVKAFSRSEKEEVPDDSLTGFFTEIEPLTPLYDEIRRCIPAEDEIADDASSTLRSIRRSMRGMNDRIRAQMNNMINNSTTRSYLQDAVITMRDGRYCLPVKAEAKSQIPGMVHDQSSSGSTLFIEPMAVVNLNNEYKELLLKEKDEIEKILENLSNLTANFSEQIAADYTILAELDFIFAKAAYAQTYNGVAPTFNNEGYLHIKKGRHPLLDKKKSGSDRCHARQRFQAFDCNRSKHRW